LKEFHERIEHHPYRKYRPPCPHQRAGQRRQAHDRRRRIITQIQAARAALQSVSKIKRKVIFCASQRNGRKGSVSGCRGPSTIPLARQMVSVAGKILIPVILITDMFLPNDTVFKPPLSNRCCPDELGQQKNSNQSTCNYSC